MVLADENLDNRIIHILRDNNIEVFSISEELHGISDLEIIQIARKTNLIILTEDKDFGEWVFAHKEDNVSVIFIRYHHRDYVEIGKTLVKVLTDKSVELAGYFTTITSSKMRRRKI